MATYKIMNVNELIDYVSNGICGETLSFASYWNNANKEYDNVCDWYGVILLQLIDSKTLIFNWYGGGQAIAVDVNCKEDIDCAKEIIAHYFKNFDIGIDGKVLVEF